MSARRKVTPPEKWDAAFEAVADLVENLQAKVALLEEQVAELQRALWAVALHTGDKQVEVERLLEGLTRRDEQTLTTLERFIPEARRDEAHKAWESTRAEPRTD